MIENWRPVVGYEGLYEVSDMGRVRSLDRLDSLGRRRQGRMLRLQGHSQNYRQVGLAPRTTSGQAPATRMFRVHAVVLNAFVGPCPGGKVGCHKNDVPWDNRLENLRWDTPKANRRDQLRNRAGLAGRRRSTRTPHSGACARSHLLVEPNLTAPQHGGRRRCLACQRGHNSVTTARRKGVLLSLVREADRHYRLLMGGSQERAS